MRSNCEKHPQYARGVYIAYDADGLAWRVQRDSRAHRDSRWSAMPSHAAAASDNRMIIRGSTLDAVAEKVGLSRHPASGTTGAEETTR